MRAVVTAGGTSEPIDDVRVVTNFSSGRFGAAIANELASHGVEVTLLAGRALASHPEWIDPRVRTVPFGSFLELDRALARAIVPPPELLFMAAAVSDYSPEPHAGKISSAAEELTLRFRRNPKLLGTLRRRCGPATFLVGFKLLSGVSREELVAVAERQIAAASADLCVANDLRDLVHDRHPLVLVTPEGAASPRSGTKAEVARELVEFSLARRATTRFQEADRGADPRLAPIDATDAANGGGQPKGGHPAEARGGEGAGGWLDATTLLRVAGACGWTTQAVGHRAGHGLWITPRTPGPWTPDDLVHVEVDTASRTVRHGPGTAPARGAPLHARVLDAFPEVHGLVQVRDALVLPTATTTFPWPAGTVEEGLEVGRALLGAARRGRWDGGGFALELVDQGWLLGVRSARRLEQDWREAREGWQEHVAGAGFDPALATATPIVARDRIVGVAARFVVRTEADSPDEAWSTWLHPHHRHSGHGERVVDRLAADRRRVVAGDACAVTAWYAERGWRTERREARAVLLDPPTLRDDLVPAASVCLVDALSGKILVGRRRTAPFEGYWAFPGGRLEPGESALDGALRELEEETGLRPEWFEELGTTEVTVGDRPGYRVTNVRLAIAGTPPPTATAELDARWVTRSEARGLRPMAAGTRRVLRAADPTIV